jgi:hypothetical protein
MSEQPQEWTVTQIGQVMYGDKCLVTAFNYAEGKALVDAHNAELQARLLNQAYQYGLAHGETAKLLVAEREKVDEMRGELDAIKKRLAEHGYTFDGNIADATLHFVQQLQDKLAAERRKSKPYSYQRIPKEGK